MRPVLNQAAVSALGLANSFAGKLALALALALASLATPPPSPAEKK